MQDTVESGKVLRVWQGPLAEGLSLPFYAYDEDAALQFQAAVPAIIPPLSGGNIITDLCCIEPEGHWLDVRSRGATAVLGGLFGLSIVDPEYRGKLNFYVNNTSTRWLYVPRGAVAAQVVLHPFVRPKVVGISKEEFERLSNTSRGDSRMGKSGFKPRHLTEEEVAKFLKTGSIS